MVVLRPIKRETLQDFLNISQMLNVSTFGNTADIWRLAGSGGTKTVSFTNPQMKKSQGVKSGDRGGHSINASPSFSCASYPPLWQVSIEIPSHVFVLSRRAVLFKDVIITVFIQLWHQPVF